MGLLQREVAWELGVHTSTYCNWEVGRTEAENRYLPAIHRFLGFCPFDPAWTLGERLRAAREARGLSRETAARLVGVDAGTIWRAESRRGDLTARSLVTLGRILSGAL